MSQIEQLGRIDPVEAVIAGTGQDPQRSALELLARGAIEPRDTAVLIEAADTTDYQPDDLVADRLSAAAKEANYINEWLTIGSVAIGFTTALAFGAAVEQYFPLDSKDTIQFSMTDLKNLLIVTASAAVAGTIGFIAMDNSRVLNRRGRRMARKRLNRHEDNLLNDCLDFASN